MNAIHDAALAAYDAGLAVLPINDDGTKSPPFKWAQFQAQRPNRGLIREWFANGRYSGMAVICGAASGNLECLDFDDANTYRLFIDTAEGIGLGSIVDRIRAGFEDRTPDEGAHLLYYCETIGRNEQLAARPINDPARPKQKQEPLIETRAEGGFAITSPSNGTTHPSGKAWRLISGSIKSIATITPTEREYLFRLARSLDQRVPIAQERPSSEGQASDANGTRPGDAFRAKHENVESVTKLLERHNWRFVFQKGETAYYRRPGKEDRGVSATFNHGGSGLFYCFSSSTDFTTERGYNVFSVYTILEHGGDFSAAGKELARQGYGSQPKQPKIRQQPPTGQQRENVGQETDAEEDFASARSNPASSKGFAPTDFGNGERFASQHREDAKYSYRLDKWFNWDDCRFKPDDGEISQQRAKRTVRSIYAEAEREDDEEKRKAIVRHALKSEAAARIDAMLRLARSETGIPISTDDLDKDPWLFNVKNGTVDLRTGEVREHRRKDLITKVAPIVYDSAATCPRWEGFLRRSMGDNEHKVRFLQRAIGYSLTGSTTERAIFILFGGGKNGKSTLIEVVLALMGEYAMSTPTETLLAKREVGSIPNDVARLNGVRLVSARETEEGERLAEAKIKALTGGDTISARFMRSEFFDFLPTFKIFLSTNHKPIIRGTDEAIWDRIHLVPFTVRIPASERDQNLRQKLIAEASGILNWAIAGCLEWQRDGLGQPDEVRQATAGYRAEMDVLGGFLADCCVTETGAKATAKDLYQAYSRWAEENGERPISQITMGKRLSERGYDSAQVGPQRTRTWIGIRLRGQSEPEQSDDNSTQSDKNEAVF